MNRPEQDLQIAIMNHYRARRVPGVFGFHVPNAGRRSMYVGKKLKEAGLTPGVHDLVFIRMGKTFMLEVKDTNGRLSKAQENVHAAVKDAGAESAVADNLDEALITLECWGIIKRDSNHRVPEASQGTQGA